MPGKQNRSSLTTDDSLVRLLCLPPDEQNTVLDAFDRALRAAERRVIKKEVQVYRAGLSITVPSTVGTPPC